MEPDFVKKIYKSIVLTWGLSMAWCLALWRPWWALSVTLGVLMGTGILASFAYAIPGIIAPGVMKPKKALLRLALIKYPVICLALYLLTRWSRADLPAFCGGIVLVHLAILFKVLGARLAAAPGSEGC